MDSRHLLNVHYNSPVCFDCSVEFFTSFPTSFSQAVPEVSLPSCALLSSAFPDAFALLSFHSLQSSMPAEQGAWSDNGALGWASVGSKYNPVQTSWLQKLLKTIREQAFGMSHAARVSSFPKGSQCRSVVSHFKSRGNGHPNPKRMSGLFWPRKEASWRTGAKAGVVKAHQAVGNQSVHCFSWNYHVVKSWTKHLTWHLEVTCHKLETIFRDSKLLNFSAPQETLKSIIIYLSLWVLTAFIYFGIL